VVPKDISKVFLGDKSAQSAVLIITSGFTVMDFGQAICLQYLPILGCGVD
jgi:hypothetical protein